MIFVDTNVISETLSKAPNQRVIAWLARYDADIAVSSMAIAEVSFGIERIHLEQRAKRLQIRFDKWRKRHAGNVFGFNEEAAFVYAEILAHAQFRGRPMSVADGIIAAVALVNGGRLATRNLRHFETTGLDLISPWD